MSAPPFPLPLARQATSSGFLAPRLAAPWPCSQRLTKLLADRQRAVSGYQGKLSNAGYMAKAPPNVVQETQKMLLDAQAELQMVERSLRELT